MIFWVVLVYFGDFCMIFITFKHFQTCVCSIKSYFGRFYNNIERNQECHNLHLWLNCFLAVWYDTNHIVKNLPFLPANCRFDCRQKKFGKKPMSKHTLVFSYNYSIVFQFACIANTLIHFMYETDRLFFVKLISNSSYILKICQFTPSDVNSETLQKSMFLQYLYHIHISSQNYLWQLNLWKHCQLKNYE